jgi:hypothetical protein
MRNSPPSPPSLANAAEARKKEDATVSGCVPRVSFRVSLPVMGACGLSAQVKVAHYEYRRRACIARSVDVGVVHRTSSCAERLIAPAFAPLRSYRCRVDLFEEHGGVRDATANRSAVFDSAGEFHAVQPRAGDGRLLAD